MLERCYSYRAPQQQADRKFSKGTNGVLSSSAAPNESIKSFETLRPQYTCAGPSTLAGRTLAQNAYLFPGQNRNCHWKFIATTVRFNARNRTMSLFHNNSNNITVAFFGLQWRIMRVSVGGILTLTNILPL